MMLDHLGEEAAGHAVERAVADVLARKEVSTPDLGGVAKTAQITEAVIESMDRQRAAHG